MAKRNERPLVIGVDFDGVCAEDCGTWQGRGVFGKPIPETRVLLKLLKAWGWEVALWTTRGEVDDLKRFCAEHDLPVDYWPGENPYRHEERGASDKLKADIYLDDRGVRFSRDIQTVLDTIMATRNYRDRLCKVSTVDALVGVVEAYQSVGRTVVFTCGCFDLLHRGHVRMLQEARDLGDLLIAAVNNDSAVRSLKGDGRPYVPLDGRAEMLSALHCVDFVLPFGVDPLPLIDALMPDVFAKGEHSPLEVMWCERRGIKIHSCRLLDGWSTTELSRSIREGKTHGMD